MDIILLLQNIKLQFKNITFQVGWHNDLYKEKMLIMAEQLSVYTPGSSIYVVLYSVVEVQDS